MHVSFVPEQDRLLLRVSTRGGEEYRLWITRRYMKRLWPALMALLPPGPEQTVARRAEGEKLPLVLEGRRAAGDTAPSLSHNAPTRQTPLGNEPILLTRARVKTAGPSRHVLALYPAAGEGLEIVLDQPMLHALTRLLAAAVQRTDWGLDLGPPSPNLTPGESSRRH